MEKSVGNVPARRPAPVLTRQFSINSSKLPELLLKSTMTETHESKEPSTTTSHGHDQDDHDGHRVSWKTFKDRLLIRRATSAFTGTTLSLEPPTSPAGEPIRVSLMALLEQTDTLTGGSNKKPTPSIEEEAEEEEEEEKHLAHECCVCLVRHNGTPFVPCGHTFCRLCSRELWIVRKNYCPLCNAYILEILDVF